MHVDLTCADFFWGYYDFDLTTLHTRNCVSIMRVQGHVQMKE